MSKQTRIKVAPLRCFACTRKVLRKRQKWRKICHCVGVNVERFKIWVKKIIQLFCNAEFIKFIIIGGINTVSGTALALLFAMHIQENLSMVSGYVGSLTLAYFLNTFFVFKIKPALMRYAKFCLSYVPNFIINNMVFVLLFNLMKLNKYIAILLTACVGLPVTFVCVKFFAFGKEKPK
jgi:putative flippase GtrA